MQHLSMAANDSQRRHGLDLLAGISVAGIILPEAIAYAGLANMPPMAGIVAACIGLFVYGALGTSRFAIVAGTSSSAVVLLAALHSFIDSTHLLQLSSALVIVTGVMFLICAIFRLGRIAHFIARPVVRGLALGLAVTIVLRQFAKITGIYGAQSDVLPLSYELLRRVQEWNPYSLALGIATLMLLFLCKRWPRIPGPLLAMIGGVFLSTWFDLYSHHIAVVGDITVTEGLLALQLHIPMLLDDEWLRVTELSLALMLIIFAESYSSIRTTALQQGDAINVNRDLLALGIANLCCGLLNALPVGAGYSATVTNQVIGARSRLVGFSAAIYILITLWLLLKYVALIPEPVLAAIVIYAMQHALSFKPLQPYIRWRRDRLVVLVSVVAVIMLGVLDGLLVSVAFSMVLLVRGLAQPRISVLGRLQETHDYVPMDSHAEVHALANTLIIRPDEPLFFANADDMFGKALDILRQSRDIHTLILSLEESPNIDGTVMEALDQFSKDVRKHGCKLYLARLKLPVFTVLQCAQLPELRISVLNTGSVAAVVNTLSS